MRGGCGGRALRVVRDFNFIPRQPEGIVSGRAFIQRVLSFSLLAIALAFSCVPADAADTIKVGAIGSASGPAAFLGDPEEKTLHAYVDSINASGGIAGRQIELFIYDDSSDAAKANSFAKRLIQQDNVDFISAHRPQDRRWHSSSWWRRRRCRCWLSARVASSSNRSGNSSSACPIRTALPRKRCSIT